MYKSLASYPEHEFNPFPVTPVSPRDYMVAMDSDSKPMNYMAYGLSMTVSNRSTIAMLLYLASKPLSGDNEVIIPAKELEKMTGAKGRVTYYRILSELLEAGIIARRKHARNIFYMNPEYIRTFNN